MDRRSLWRKEALSLSDHNAFQQRGADLIDDAGALADQSLARGMLRWKKHQQNQW
jgi:hypothetical protein